MTRSLDFYTSFLLATGCFQDVQAWSPLVSRRSLVEGAAAAVVGLSTASSANAACLPGDLSTDCIGVYKLPYQDSKESTWLQDKDILAEFAPDIRYIKVDEQPATPELAKKELEAQRKQAKILFLF